METVKRYIPNYEVEFKTMRELYAKRAAIGDPDVNIKTKLIMPELNRLVDDKVFDSLNKKEIRTIKRNMKNEVLAYLKGETKEGNLKPEKTSRTSNEALDLAISEILNDVSGLKYNNQKLNYSHLENDFDPYELKIPKPFKDRGQSGKKRARINQTQLKRRLMVPFEKYDSPKIEASVRKLITQIKKIYQDRSERPSDLEFKITDVSMLKVFNTQNLADFEKRDETYKYWKEAHVGLNELVKEVGELGTLLEDVDEDVDVKAFLKAIGTPSQRDDDTDDPKTIGLLNYVQDFGSKVIELSDIDDRPMEFLELFFKQQGFLAEQKKNVNITAEQYMAEGDGSNKDGGTGAHMQTHIMRDEDLADDALDLKEIKELGKELSNKHHMDALGVLHFDRNLDNLSLISGESLESLTETLRNFFEEIKKEDIDAELVFIIDDEIDEAFENFVKTIESLEDFKSKSGETYLPVFFADEPELETHYKEIKSSDYFEKIDEFMLAFKNLIEGDVKSQSPARIDTGSLTGIGTGSVSDDVPTGTGLFNYDKYLEGRSGTIRGKLTLVKEKNEKIIEKFKTISALILEWFTDQKFSPHLMGVELPFSNDTALRAIAIYDVPEDSKNLNQILNKVFMEDGEAFLEQKDVVKINAFLDTLSKGDSITNFTEIKEKANVFYETISNLYENDYASEKAKVEIASILGSIWQFTEKPDIKWKGLNIIASYKKVFVNELNEISTLQVLADIIRSNKTMFDKDDADASALLSNLDRVSKSDINKKLLEAHDTLRILKSKPVMYSMKNENNFDDMDDMLTKMEKEYQIDMSANEIISVINKIDSFEGIAKEHGISSEHVYVIKANFR